ncbi:hypothetical protein [Asticcacaulis sp. AC402]|uniref:hypothetical protein n=1 Tax=Asticcacaulis sp. AC402 TaxID=1282361 RepID=UPI0012DBDCCA|nr:hypothetical protein [Asticcacaulis sp. AC402]
MSLEVVYGQQATDNPGQVRIIGGLPNLHLALGHDPFIFQDPVYPKAIQTRFLMLMVGYSDVRTHQLTSCHRNRKQGSTILSVNAEMIAFEGRLSVMKAAGTVLFMMFCFYSVAFSNADNHQYYKWLFQPWAQPVRWLLGIAAAWLTVTTTILLVKSLSGSPLIKVEDGWVEVNGLKKGKFPVSEIDTISIRSSRYTIKVGRKRYHLPLVFCRDRGWLMERMGELAVIVNKSSALGDT